MSSSSSYPQVSLAAEELLSRIAELGVNLTGHFEGSESLQHVTAFWNSWHQLSSRLKANSCNVAVLGLAKSGDAVVAALPCGCARLPVTVPCADTGVGC